MRVFTRHILAIVPMFVATAMQAQRQQATPAVTTISAEARAALDMLGPQSSAEIEVHQAWYRDRPVTYYGFGVSAQPMVVGRVVWPIHGFDMQGNPVAIRGQRPIFSSLPGLAGYSGVWRLTYLVTADRAQPNEVRDTESAEALIRRKRARWQETNLTYNLPITVRGAKLPGDSTTTPMIGSVRGAKSSSSTSVRRALRRCRCSRSSVDARRPASPIWCATSSW